MQTRLESLKDEIKNSEVVGSAGAGMVKVTLSGDYKVKKVELDPTLLTPENNSVLETLLIGAFNEASQQVEQLLTSKAMSVTL